MHCVHLLCCQCSLTTDVSSTVNNLNPCTDLAGPRKRQQQQRTVNMSEKDGFPSAYSSFAVSVDSRNAERPIYSTPPLESSNGILRHTRPGHEKRRSLSPMSSDRLDRVSAKPSVRFTRDTIHEYGHHNEQQPMHHRRSSTAAFLEYIRTHLPESQRRGSISLTPKRGLALFAVSYRLFCTVVSDPEADVFSRSCFLRLTSPWHYYLCSQTSLVSVGQLR